MAINSRTATKSRFSELAQVAMRLAAQRPSGLSFPGHHRSAPQDLQAALFLAKQVIPRVLGQCPDDVLGIAGGRHAH
jgi:hypothetical protein